MLTPPYLERYRALRASTASLHELPRRAVHTVQYEELVAAPAETLQGIADFLEITPAFDVTTHSSRIAASCCRALLRGCACTGEHGEAVAARVANPARGHGGVGGA